MGKGSDVPVLFIQTVDWPGTLTWSYNCVFNFWTVVDQTDSLIIRKLILLDRVVLSVVFLIIKILLLLQLLNFPVSFGLFCLLLGLGLVIITVYLIIVSAFFYTQTPLGDLEKLLLNFTSIF